MQTLPVQEPSGAIENVVKEVTSPRELFEASKPWALYVCDVPALFVALEGLIVMWSSAPAPTCSEAVPVLPALVPVTVCGPATDAVQVAPVHEPFGEIENVVVEVTSAIGLSYWSRDSAAYVWDAPDAMVAETGASPRWSNAPGFTVSDPVLVFPELLPVTVCEPETVAVQTFAVHEPFARIENVVRAVTSPSELFAASKPSAVYVCEPPALIVALAGLITMWSTPDVLTCSEAVPVVPASVPVTVCAPATEAVQVASVQEPSGAIENVVERTR